MSSQVFSLITIKNLTKHTSIQNPKMYCLCCIISVFFIVNTPKCIGYKIIETELFVEVKGDSQKLPYETLSSSILEEAVPKIQNHVKLSNLNIEYSILKINLDNMTRLERLYLDDVELSGLPSSTSDKLELPNLWDFDLYLPHIKRELTTDQLILDLIFVKLEANDNKLLDASRFKFIDIRLVGGIYIYLNNSTMACGTLRFLHFNFNPCKNFIYEVVYVYKSVIDPYSLHKNVKEIDFRECNFMYDYANENVTNTSLILNENFDYPNLKRLGIEQDSMIIYSLPSNLSILEIRDTHIFSGNKNINSSNKYESKLLKLYLLNCTINVNNFNHSLFQSVEMIRYKDMKLLGGRGNIIHKFLKKFNALSELEFEPNEAYCDLRWIPKNIKSLKLYCKNIQSSKNITFRHLDYLLIRGTLKSEVINQINLTFPNLTSIDVTTDARYSSIKWIKTLRHISFTSFNNYISDPKTKNFLIRINCPLEFEQLHLIKNETTGKWTCQNSTEPLLSSKFLMFREIYGIGIFTTCVIGIAGNVGIILIFQRKNLKCSTGILLCGLAVFDSVVLIINLFSLTYFSLKLTAFQKSDLLNVPNDSMLGILWWKVNVERSNIMRLVERQVEIFYPISKTAYTGSVYMTIIITLERYFAVLYPMKVRKYFGRKKAIGLLIGVIVFAVVINSSRWFEAQNFYTSAYVSEEKFNFIQKYTFKRVKSKTNIFGSNSFAFLYHFVFWNILMYAIPIPLLIFLNCWIFIAVRESSKFRKISSALPQRMQSNQQDDEASALTNMLICVSMIFVTSNITTGLIVFYCWMDLGIEDFADIEAYCCIPITINCAVNFIIYTVMGKRFRAELVCIFNEVKNAVLGCIGKPIDIKRVNSTYVTGSERRENIELK